MRRFKLVWPVVLLLLLLTASWPVAQAQNDDDIRVLEGRAENRFPDGIGFFVSAEGPDEITDIRVRFKKIGQSNQTGYRVVEFEPGSQVHGESLIRSGGNEYIPPGTRIAYSFELRDTAGRRKRTEEQVLVYLDNRFQWETMSDGMVTVFYQALEGEAAARVVLESAKAALDHMGPILGVSPSDPLHIVTYRSYPHMADVLPFRSRATEQQLITQGMAFSEERVLLVHSNDRSVRGTASHEFTHLLVADAVGPAISQVPSWLNEGLAEYANIEPDGTFLAYLERAMADGTLRPLRYQGDFGGSPRDIIVAYGQGLSVVTYLIDTYGEDKIGQLMQAISHTLDIDRALLEVYGFDQHGLDTEWRLSKGLEPFPSPEELERQRAASQPTATPEPAPASSASSVEVPREVPSPTPRANLPAEPGDTAATVQAAATPAPAAEPQRPAATPGCSAPLPVGRIPGELGMLFLLGMPLTLRRLRWPAGLRPGSRPRVNGSGD